MCLLPGGTPAVAGTPAQNAIALPAVDTPDLSKRLALGGFGDFQSRVREAGLGTSVKTKSISSAILDPTRQSR